MGQFSSSFHVFSLKERRKGRNSSKKEDIQTLKGKRVVLPKKQWCKIKGGRTSKEQRIEKCSRQVYVVNVFKVENRHIMVVFDFVRLFSLWHQDTLRAIMSCFLLFLIKVLSTGCPIEDYFYSKYSIKNLIVSLVVFTIFSYGILRINRYLATKNEFLALQERE